MSIGTLHRFVAMLGLAAAAMLPVAGAATYRVGSGTGCTHSSIQSAINAARINPGHDTIRITHSLVYVGQALLVRDQDVTLSGGYSSCLGGRDLYPLQTRISGSGGSAESVLRVRGFGRVTLEWLELRDGDDLGSSDQHGGGLDIADGPHEVVLDTVAIVDNRAARGGGISMRNTASLHLDDSKLVLLGDTRIDRNSSATTGGGVFCWRSKLTMSGPRNRIWNNYAALAGGGLRIEECHALIGSGSTDPSGTISYNEGYDGGGMSVGGTTGAVLPAYVILYTNDSSAPMTLHGNAARGSGGALEVESGASVHAFDVRITDNAAQVSGGAVRLADFGGGLGWVTLFNMLGALDERAPPDAVRCEPALRCNRISGNFARNTSGVYQPGAAVIAQVRQPAATRLYVDALLRGTTIEHNYGDTLLEVVPGDTGNSIAWIEIYGTLVHSNTTRRVLIRSLPPNGTGRPGALEVHASTIVDNKITGAVVSGTGPAATEPSGVRLTRSIVFQPGSPTLEVLSGAVSPAEIAYVMATEVASLPPSPTIVASADPGFIDGASGNYRLRGDSDALDFAPPGALLTRDEADGAPRPVDLPQITNLYGPQDLGAYERQQ